MKKTNKKGFTIVELVIVIAVIAILAAVLIPTFSDVVKNANIAAAKENMRNAYTEAILEHMNATEETTCAGHGEDYKFTWGEDGVTVEYPATITDSDVTDALDDLAEALGLNVD